MDIHCALCGIVVSLQTVYRYIIRPVDLIPVGFRSIGSILIEISIDYISVLEVPSSNPSRSQIFLSFNSIGQRICVRPPAQSNNFVRGRWKPARTQIFLFFQIFFIFAFLDIVQYRCTARTCPLAQSNNLVCGQWIETRPDPNFFILIPWWSSCSTSAAAVFAVLFVGC